ncbi:MAG TPA: 4Fe-4S ferredoxin [Bryobacteraceae bacterium]|nr:4Fe-4S ferredoxin [Bryobacteraceae bacterium]
MSDRVSMDTDIVCVGFGPAAGGFLITLAPKLAELERPPQIMCCERADGMGFGVSGVVTRARGIRQSFPNLDTATIPLAAPVTEEKLVYLLDPIGASHRSLPLRALDTLLSAARPCNHGIELPYIPAFLHKKDGLVLSIGQFNQWVGEQIMMSGRAQIWPSMPVAGPIIEGERVTGVRLAEGTDIRARLTVVADGPVGAVGRALDQTFGAPPGFERNEWAVGCKMVVDLPADSPLETGIVIHTLGFPEPEIFGFLYVHPEGVASVGIFVPCFLHSPVRTSYRYLQHFIQHPFLWRWLKGARMRSWGAKSLLESGRRGEPWLAGNGYVRIGEGSGSTNVLTGSGVDEAWTTGMQLADGVFELLRENAPFTRENLERTYVARRRQSWVEHEARIAENARNGFERGFLTGVLGMALAGLTKGQLLVHRNQKARQAVSPARYFRGRLSPELLATLHHDARASAVPLHDAVMNRLGWPEIDYDRALLVSHQDALLMGGKVQGSPGFADHVTFRNPELCAACEVQLCVEMCSGQAIGPSADGGAPTFDREKCVHCGACLWNCAHANVDFRAGGGGLHSVEN